MQNSGSDFGKPLTDDDVEVPALLCLGKAEASLVPKREECYWAYPGSQVCVSTVELSVMFLLDI